MTLRLRDRHHATSIVLMVAFLWGESRGDAQERFGGSIEAGNIRLNVAGSVPNPAGNFVLDFVPTWTVKVSVDKSQSASDLDVSFEAIEENKSLTGHDPGVRLDITLRGELRSDSLDLNPVRFTGINHAFGSPEMEGLQLELTGTYHNRDFASSFSEIIQLDNVSVLTLGYEDHPDQLLANVSGAGTSPDDTRILVDLEPEFGITNATVRFPFSTEFFTLLPIPVEPPVILTAGDADQDLDFDQLDLVKVQIAAKYLTGQPATWGDGDWDGAPGGSPGNPPAGSGLFDQLDVVRALTAGAYLTGPYAAIAGEGVAADDQTSIVYNAATGEVAVDAPAGTELTSINIDSAAGIFNGQAAQNLGGSFDNDADNNIFKATFGGSFGSLSFGRVALSGLSEDSLLNDLTVVGSIAGGGPLGNVDLIHVPEPACLALLVLGGALLFGCRNQHQGIKLPGQDSNLE